jgi:hypothetical protein
MRFQNLLGMLVTLTACGGSRVQPKIVTAEEFRLMDGDLKRATLGMEKGQPVFALFDDKGTAKLRTELDPSGRPSMSMFSNSDPTKAAAMLEVDDKGAHVLFRGSGKEESYLFQKSDGTAGVVLGGPEGTHRAELKLSPNGDVDITLFDAGGKPSFATTVSRTGAVQRPADSTR